METGNESFRSLIVPHFEGQINPPSGYNLDGIKIYIYMAN